MKGSVIIKDVDSLSSYFEILDYFEGDLSILRELIENVPKAIKIISESMLKESIPKDVDKETEEKIASGLDALFTKFSEAYDLVVKGEQNEIEMPTSDETVLIVFGKIFRFIMLEKYTLNMGLVYLLAKFENFLEMLLRFTFLRKPAILMTKEKNITYEELFGFSNYTELLRFIIEKETSSLLTEDIEQINQYFEKRFNIELSSFVVDWVKFKERFYRRNLIVHNNGRVNRIYIEKTGYQQEDNVLWADQVYLKESLELFGEMSRKIIERFNGKFNE